MEPFEPPMRPEREIEADWSALCASGRRRKDVIADGNKIGEVVHETFIAEDAGELGDYAKLVQRIEDEGGKNPRIRFTYYVKRPGWKSWKLGGQTSLMLSLEDARKLLKQAAKEGII